MKFFKLFFLVSTFLFAGFGTVIHKGGFPSEEEAFKVSAVQVGDVIETKIILGDKIHVTADTLKYFISKPQEILLDIKKPTPEKVDGDMVYEKDIIVNIPIKDIASKVSGDYTLRINFSGCSDNGICYNPISKSYDFKGDPSTQISFFDKLKNALDESNPNGIVDLLIGESSFFIILLCNVT